MTQYARIRDGRVVRVGLPKVGTLADGRQVSGYDRLDAATLAVEGWLPYTETRPDYDPATKRLVLTYEVGETSATGVYTVEPLPPPDPAPPTRDEFDAITDAVAILTLAALTGGA